MEFRGGKIVIEPSKTEANAYEGIVVAETNFDECNHPVGQHIWIKIKEQTDGSYWAQHQWYYANSGCRENPVRGAAALRVFEEAGGSKFLKVCLSEPGTTQPTISPSDAVGGSPFGCYESARSVGYP